MASKHTPVYGLNQWSLEDGIIMSEFNEDNQKTEQALVQADTSIAALQQTTEILRADQIALEQAITAAQLEAKVDRNTIMLELLSVKDSIPHIAAGTYVGTGTCGEANPNSLTFTFEPKLLIITTDIPNTGTGEARGTYSATPVIIPYGSPSFNFWYSHAGHVQYDTYSCAVTWEDTTIRWWNKQAGITESAYMQLNDKNVTYRYFAIG